MAYPDEQLRKTVIAWSIAAQPGEQCVLWDLDRHVGADRPWGMDLDRITAFEADIPRGYRRCSL